MIHCFFDTFDVQVHLFCKFVPGVGSEFRVVVLAVIGVPEIGHRLVQANEPVTGLLVRHILGVVSE